MTHYIFLGEMIQLVNFLGDMIRLFFYPKFESQNISEISNIFVNFPQGSISAEMVQIEEHIFQTGLGNIKKLERYNLELPPKQQQSPPGLFHF